MREPNLQIFFDPFSTLSSFQEALSFHGFGARAMRFPIGDEPRTASSLSVKGAAIKCVVMFQESSGQVFSLSNIRLLCRSADNDVCEETKHWIRTYDSPRRINSRPLYR
jgi:hypothetical protein